MELTDINDIKALLTRHGFHFSKALGQNFLKEAWVPERIALSSGAAPDTAVLEIGPGIGCLTEQLARRAGRVVAVELDRALLPVLAETLAPYGNTEIVNADIMRLDLSALVNEKFGGLRPLVCANLPYNITTPVLTALISSGLFESITVMVQSEVARRICAEAGTAEYGAFTLYVDYHCRAELLFDVGAECFVPQPKVNSAVVRLTAREMPPVDTDEALLFRVIRAAFAQRRKTLINALGSAFGSDFSKDTLADIITSCGFDLRIRGEVLSLADFARLTDAIKNRSNTVKSE